MEDNNGKYTVTRNYLYKNDKGRKFKILLPPTEIIDNNYSEGQSGELVKTETTSESTGIDFSLYLKRVNAIINMFWVVLECLQIAMNQTGMSHCVITKFPVLAIAIWRKKDEDSLRYDWGINTEKLVIKGTHAEEMAINSALKQVKREDFVLEAIIVVSPNIEKISSCGECLQAIAEYSPLNYPTIIFGCTNDLKNISVTSLRDLDPKQFPAENQKDFLEGKSELEIADAGGNGKEIFDGSHSLGEFTKSTHVIATM